jgi:hypothetical protein
MEADGSNQAASYPTVGKVESGVKNAIICSRISDGRAITVVDMIMVDSSVYWRRQSGVQLSTEHPSTLNCLGNFCKSWRGITQAPARHVSF